MKYPFCQLRSAVLAVSSPRSCSPPAYLVEGRGIWGSKVGKGKSIDLAKTLLNNHQNIDLLPTLLLTNPKHSTIYITKKKPDSIPVRAATMSILYSIPLVSFYVMHYPIHEPPPSSLSFDVVSFPLPVGYLHQMNGHQMSIKVHEFI